MTPGPFVVILVLPSELGAIVMGEVVSFPTKSVRDWAMIERAMDEALSRESLSAAFQARLIERMKAFYEVIQLDFNFTINVPLGDGIPKAQADFILGQIGEKFGAVSTERLQAFTYKLFFERLAVEIDLCRALNI